MAQSSHREIELDLMYREIKDLQQILSTLQEDDEIVNGFVFDSLKESSIRVPSDVLQIIISYIGDHFKKQTANESAKRIRDYIVDTDEQLIDLGTPWYGPSVWTPTPIMIIALCCCCPCILILLILRCIIFIITCGCCCDGEGVEWIKQNICCRS